MLSKSRLSLRSLAYLLHHSQIKKWPRLQKYSSTNVISAERLNQSSVPSQITIPTRIPREPTSILQALADTVDYDPTSFALPLIDDPGAVLSSQRLTKLLVLSEASGRKVANHASSMFPKRLQYDTSAPTVEDFTPKILLYGNTEESLIERLSLNLVKEAKQIYMRMVETGIDISVEAKLLYLDTLCRYNCKDEEYYQSMTERYFFRKSEDDHWQPNSTLTELYEQLCATYPQVYISMICGMCSYSNFADAHQIYIKALEEGILFPVEVHNSILSGLVAVFKNIDDVKAQSEKILTHLETNGIRPNLQTFNAIICQMKLVPPYTDRYPYSLRLLKEMECCGIEPSLTTYYHLTQMVYRSANTRYGDVLKSFIDIISKQRPIAVRDLEDNLFFLNAMIAARTTIDPDTAHRLYKLAWTGTNKALLGNVMSCYRFHHYYMFTVVASEPMDKIMQVYTDIVPRVYMPDNKCWIEIFNAIDLYEGYQHVPQIYEDIKAVSYLYNAPNAVRFSKMLIPKHAKPEIMQQLSDIADDMYRQWESETPPPASKIMTAPVFYNFIQLSLTMNDVDKAYDWFEKYNSSIHIKSELKESAALALLAAKLISMKRYEDMLNVLQVMADLRFHDDLNKLVKDETFPAEISEMVKVLKAAPKPNLYEKGIHSVGYQDNDRQVKGSDRRIDNERRQGGDGRRDNERRQGSDGRRDNERRHGSDGRRDNERRQGSEQRKGWRNKQKDDLD